eukprot:2410204-Pyramimonas_sp.AAC.1
MQPWGGALKQQTLLDELSGPLHLGFVASAGAEMLLQQHVPTAAHAVNHHLVRQAQQRPRRLLRL